MKRGASILVSAVALFATSGCAGHNELNIRVKPTGYAAGEQAVSFRIAEARAHFALGNVALALEGFRKARRVAPESVDALNGIAICYDRMGRFDLSRRYYEQALAVAPSNPKLYANLALSLEIQGRQLDAEIIRRELQGRLAIRNSSSTTSQPTAKLTAKTAHAGSVPEGVALGRTEMEPVAARKPRSQPDRITRLERTSLGEVTLVTSDKPIWKTRSADQPPRQLVAHNRPERPLTHPLMLLNGARVDGLAAKTRWDLRHQRWHRVTIGNALEARARSVILYPAGGRAEALLLAKRLGFPIRQRESDGRWFFVVLGRDAVILRRRRQS